MLSSPHSGRQIIFNFSIAVKETCYIRALMLQAALPAFTSTLLQAWQVQALPGFTPPSRHNNYFVVVVEIYCFWQATVAYMYFTTPTHSARATSCNMLAQGHPFARRVFISPGLFLQGVKSIQVHWIPVSLIYMHSCVSLQISAHWLWKDCLQNWRKKKSNNESWEGARVSLHFLVCPLMFPAYALHGNRQEESNHNSITALMIV